MSASRRDRVRSTRVGPPVWISRPNLAVFTVATTILAFFNRNATNFFAAMHKIPLAAALSALIWAIVQCSKNPRRQAMAKPATKLQSFPMFDADKLVAAQQRNLDAFASAGQIVVDGVKAIAQRHGEIMQSQVEHMVAAGQGVLTAKPTEFKPADQVAKAK